MKKLHLICNAHLDPIWQWTWDEGLSAVIATFKSAADLADEFDYIFCHGEALLYETIENNAPDLFARIQKLVKEGKWHISGGWYLQPDCLMPCGETFIRHIAVGKKYFFEKFGVEPTVATNYDSFGHSIGLVQILAKCGFNGYLICRPRKDVQIEYPSRFFKWIGPDGSSILVSNSASYSSGLGKATEKILHEIQAQTVGMLGSDKGANETGGLEDVDYVLWGVGNHGGGPSRKDLRDIAALRVDDTEIVHSTPERLFADDIRVGGEKTNSLVTCMPGCYSSMARVKQAYRKTENLFYATEKMLSVASLAGLEVDFNELESAEKKMLLASFHDILPGTCIEDGEKEGLGLLASCEKSMKDYRTKAFLYLTMNEPCAQPGEYPIFVFNYLPYETEQLIEAEFTLADQNWSDEICFSPRIYDEKGVELVCQQIKEDSTLTLDWRKRIVFAGKLKPFGVTRFSVKTVETPIACKQANAVQIENFIAAPICLESYEDTADPWGMSEEELKTVGKNPKEFHLMTEEEAGRYSGAGQSLSPTRIIEDGDIVTSVESLYTMEGTNAAVQYKLYKNQLYTDIKVTVEYGDKNRLIRLKLPIPEEFKNGVSVGDGPFVWEEKPDTEMCFQKWVGVQKGEDIYAVINDGIYAGKIENGYIYLTLLRGAGYCMHPIPDRELYPKDRYLPRIESGRYVYNLRLYTGRVKDVFLQAEEFANKPYAINVFPIGGEKKCAEVCVSEPVLMSTMRVDEGGRYLLRFYNPEIEEKTFGLKIRDKETKITMPKAAIVSVVFDGERFVVEDKKIVI